MSVSVTRCDEGVTGVLVLVARQLVSRPRRDGLEQAVTRLDPQQRCGDDVAMTVRCNVVAMTCRRTRLEEPVELRPKGGRELSQELIPL